MPNKDQLNTAPPVDVFPDRVHSDNYVFNELKKLLLNSTDAFGKSIRLGTTNESDLASHYDYSPERQRVYVDGTRQQILYDGYPPQFTDNEDSFSLLPQTDGEVVKLETAERFRYVVQYVIEWSLAFELHQDLNSGDVWAVGYGDADLENSGDDTPGPNADGWLVYQNSTNATNEATLAEYRSGTEVASVTVEFNELPQTWGRLAGATNWYNVGETNLEETYTELVGGEITQQNRQVGVVGNNDGKGPQTGNQQIFAAIKTGAASAGSIELEVGSIGMRTLGDVTAITRQKTFSYSRPIDVVNQWVPLLAIREDPAQENVNAQFDALEILEFTGNDDSFGLIQAFDSDNVRDTNGNVLDDGDYTTPPELNELNSVIQVSTAVEQVPNSTGTLTTSMTDPGGYQLGFGSRYSSGTGGGSERGSSAEVVQKRNIANSDVAVLLGKSPSTGTLKGQIATEQEW